MKVGFEKYSLLICKSCDIISQAFGSFYRTELFSERNCLNFKNTSLQNF